MGIFVLYTFGLTVINCVQIFFDAQVDKYQRCALGKQNAGLSGTLAFSYFMYDLIDAVITYAIANSNLRSIGIMLFLEAAFVFVLYYRILEGDPKKRRNRLATRALFDRGSACSLIDTINGMSDSEREALLRAISQPVNKGPVYIKMRGGPPLEN